MHSDVLIQKMRALFSALGLKALFSALDLKARISHVNMRATFTLNSNWDWESQRPDSDEGTSVFNSRAINEWTFNG